MNNQVYMVLQFTSIVSCRYDSVKIMQGLNFVDDSPKSIFHIKMKLNPLLKCLNKL